MSQVMKNLTHQELFGHLDNVMFTESEAAEYLEVSTATFQRYLKAKKIVADTKVGSIHLYLLNVMREFKKATRIYYYD